ncbi:5-amino-6-(D-ribitylamino)uracil--L-tyrosine 4-hydroxyphenyl transferase CofH [Methanolapillus ohkumae]|uniref:5-amino-6-(D-ribitylamino)uracil--L-tyrosine 4-hydroxyphenyl transferase n=1 Tax=Methanolapillus ohkumae TaxID=3028298 RepID=A0AA96V6S3_9EURY|nr:FO synthase [Methanosarcinaceae archaeon Am2]
MDPNKFKNKEMSKRECLELFENDAIFFDTLHAADSVRRDLCGDVVTYILNANINFTNVCTGTCQFCAFKVSKNHPSAFFLTPEQIGQKACDAKMAGAIEVCVQGGLLPEIDTHYQVEILKNIRKQTGPLGGISIHAFSPMEVFAAAENAGLDLKTALTMLKEAGLDSIPGTAAEILVDDVRKTLCPDKISADEWEKVITAAHKTKIPTTCTIMYGHIEENEDRVEHLFRLKKIQEETGGFTEFIPLTFLHENTPLSKRGLVESGSSGLLDLKMYAIPRLLFKEKLPNIQVSWVKLGTKFSQVGLCAGANDFGGTLMEENISRAAGSKYGSSMTRQKIENCIRQIGRVPKLRNTQYKIIDESQQKGSIPVY